MTNLDLNTVNKLALVYLYKQNLTVEQCIYNSPHLVYKALWCCGNMSKIDPDPCSLTVCIASSAAGILHIQT